MTQTKPELYVEQLSALMTGISYKTSAEMAKELGPFPNYEKNAKAYAESYYQTIARCSVTVTFLMDIEELNNQSPVPLDH